VTGTSQRLQIGLRHGQRMLVRPSHTAPEVDDAWSGFKDMPPVFATAMMIGFIEQYFQWRMRAVDN